MKKASSAKKKMPSSSFITKFASCIDISEIIVVGSRLLFHSTSPVPAFDVSNREVDNQQVLLLLEPPLGLHQR
jgi:hypothetical protein